MLAAKPRASCASVTCAPVTPDEYLEYITEYSCDTTALLQVLREASAGSIGFTFPLTKAPTDNSTAFDALRSSDSTAVHATLIYTVCVMLVLMCAECRKPIECSL